jgi:hypothetical protein
VTGWKVTEAGALTAGGEVHEPGAVFSAPEEVVAQALARGLVEPAKSQPKQRSSKS